MNIRDARVLIAGGTGGLGEGIVRSLMGRGAHVMVPTRNPEKLNALNEYVADIRTGSLEGVTGSLRSSTVLPTASNCRSVNYVHPRYETPYSGR